MLKTSPTLPDPTDQAALFDQLDLEAKNTASVVLQIYQEFRQTIAREYLRDGDVVLDVGCGYGKILSNLSQRASKVVGLDISERQLELARKETYRCPSEFFHVDFADFDYQQEFDLILSFEIIEHVADAQAFLRKLARLLNSTGCAVLSTPNSGGIDRRFKRFFPVRTLVKALGGHDWSKPWKYHIKEYTVDEIATLALDAGLRIDRITGLNIFPFLISIGKIIKSKRIMEPIVKLGHSSPRLCEDVYYTLKPA